MATTGEGAVSAARATAAESPLDAERARLESELAQLEQRRLQVVAALQALDGAVGNMVTPRPLRFSPGNVAAPLRLTSPPSPPSPLDLTGVKSASPDLILRGASPPARSSSSPPTTARSRAVPA